MTEESFGSRLRRERERRQIPLSSICANTKINASIFEGLERDDVSRWPSGIFRRAFIRAYAEAVGLNADDVTRTFLERHPDPAEPPTVAGGAWSSATSAVAGSTTSSSHGAPTLPPGGIRLTLADPGAPFIGGRLLSDIRPRLSAIACDLGVVGSIAAAAYLVTGRFWLPLSAAMLSYYLGGILLLGNTPGVCLWAPGRRQPNARALTMVVTARTALLRFGLAKSAFALLASRLNKSPRTSVSPRPPETQRS